MTPSVVMLREWRESAAGYGPFGMAAFQWAASVCIDDGNPVLVTRGLNQVGAVYLLPDGPVESGPLADELERGFAAHQRDLDAANLEAIRAALKSRE